MEGVHGSVRGDRVEIEWGCTVRIGPLLRVPVQQFGTRGQGVVFQMGFVQLRQSGEGFLKVWILGDGNLEASGRLIKFPMLRCDTRRNSGPMGSGIEERWLFVRLSVHLDRVPFQLGNGQGP